MFEHLRRELEAAVQRAVAALTAAEQSLAPLQALVSQREAVRDAAEAAIAPAQQQAQSAAANRDAAQATVNQRQSARDTAAGTLDQARQDRDTIAEKEPVNPLPNGKPNPRWPAWNDRMQQTNQRVQAAEHALTAAESDLSAAVQARDAAAAGAAQVAAQLANAQTRAANAQAGLDAARAALDTAEQGLPAERQAVDQARAAPQALDARAAQLVATPLDRGVLEPLADEEYAALAELRRQRAELLARRVARLADKRVRLSTLDSFAAGLAPLREAIAGWPDAGRFPSLGPANATLGSVLDAVQQQRANPTEQRTDDFGALLARLDQAAAALQAAVAQASTERDQAAAQLTAAAQALADHQKEQP
jgi:chromosome segregation ATPase